MNDQKVDVKLMQEDSEQEICPDRCDRDLGVLYHLRLHHYRHARYKTQLLTGPRPLQFKLKTSTRQCKL